jgi:ATP-binding protein involved in chromosome partitioning
MNAPLPTTEQVTAALGGVQDPEIHKPITELGMVKSVSVRPDGVVEVGVYLTVSGCPMRDTITARVTDAVSALPGVTAVRVELDVMSEQQRADLQISLRGGKAEPVIPFAQPSSLTTVYAVASGKGGVGKSSVTVNLAAALAAAGHKVGVVDADIYGHSVPRMLGVTGRHQKVADMIMPLSGHEVKVASIGSIKPDGNPPVVWRGPMLHRALQQFLADFYWGDLDFLLLDLPPGTGDVAISVAQLLPNAEILVVTTPQLAAAEVAERAGSIAQQTRQRIAGVIENMSYLACPHCGERMDVFGSGGGEEVAARLSALTGAPVPLLGQVPLDTRLREGGDNGTPLVLSDPASPSAQELAKIASGLAAKGRGLAGRMLTLTPRLSPGGRPRFAGRARPPGQVASRSKGGRSSATAVAVAVSATAVAVPPSAAALTAAAPAPAVPSARAASWAATIAPAVSCSAGSGAGSSKRCFCTKRLGFRSSNSKSWNSGPRPSRRSALAPSAICRRSRSARPACRARRGSSFGPKITSAITARNSSLVIDRSNTLSSPSADDHARVTPSYPSPL